MAIGVPGENKNHIILDMATSTVAEGKVMVAQKGGKKLPHGALIDSLGNLTVNPEVMYGKISPAGRLAMRPAASFIFCSRLLEPRAAASAIAVPSSGVGIGLVVVLVVDEVRELILESTPQEGAQRWAVDAAQDRQGEARRLEDVLGWLLLNSMPACDNLLSNH